MREEKHSGLWEKHYFVLVKFGYVLLMAVYLILHVGKGSRVNAFTLAIAAMTACVMVIFETIGRGKRQGWLMAGEFACVLLGMRFGGSGFIVLLPMAVCDAVIRLRLPYYLMSVSLVGIAWTEDLFTYIMLCLLTAVIYWQHGGIILPYQKSARRYEEQELQLKDSIESSAADFKDEIRRTNIRYENIMLQDKARLSQVLHDKLGHRINGSVYQLEACRAIAVSNPEKADEILDRVTRSLREGMDEIRAVLRSERPDGKRMAMLNLSLLCEECKSKYGIDAQLSIEGNNGRITEPMWSVLYDNCCEAVTNAMKYARCDRMWIEIRVLNKILRCCVRDNGRGCGIIRDGMGLEGIRRRVSGLGGTVHVSGDDGFCINMLIPLESSDDIIS